LPRFAGISIKNQRNLKDTVMKISALFGAAIVLFSAVAFAHDLTYTGPIKAGETKTVRVEIPVGKMTIEVFSSFPDTKFNCQFQSGYGGIVFEQTNTSRCVGRTIVQSETTMGVSVHNLGKDADYKIWVHDS
jgi:hypothetical protein